MSYRSISYLCLAAFGTLVVVSVSGYLCLPDSEPELVVDEPEQTLSGLIADREYVIDFRVFNHGSRTLRVVGAEFT